MNTVSAANTHFEIQEGKEYPFLCFDTEDDSKELLEAGKSGFLKKVTQIAAITAAGAKYYSPGNAKDFKRWLAQREEKWIYSLNIKYDLGALFADSLDELDQTLVGGRVIKAVWGEKVFVDVFNIWPMSVAKLGQAFGLEKLATESMSTDKAYVFRDVEIIRRAMLFAWQFAEGLGIDHLQATLGGIGVGLWKHWGGQCTFDATELCREAYYGGRVELFKKVNEDRHVCYTDINSLYPDVMRGIFPGPLEKLKARRKLPKFGIVTAAVRVPECAIAPLPFRRAKDGMILYPWGRFEGSWTVAELLNAEKFGAKIEKIKEVYGTDQGEQPYRNYVERLYEARLACTNEAERLFFKLLMNTRYGRLGTTGKIGRTVWQNERNRNQGVPFGEKVLLTIQMPLAEETNWSHAAYVTAYGRIKLLDFIKTIGEGAMIYCDTDSTIFDCKTKRIPFAVGSELGQMKLESWERHCETYAPKTYNIGDKWKAKGVPVRLAREFIERGHVEFDLPFNMREAIAFYDRGNIRKLAVWRRVTRERVSGYDRKKQIGNLFYPCRIVQK